MYHSAKLDKLTHAQARKLLSGHPVRVSLGGHSPVMLSKEQHKKLARAHKKGAKSTITFDQYQRANHAMKGGDIWETMLDGLTNAGKAAIGIAPQIATALGAPELAAPIRYLEREYTMEKPKQKASARKKRGGNIMEDFGDASQKFLQGAMRDTPDFLRGPEKDPLAFLYGGRLLIDEPITTRQVVNQARDFVSDPLGTLGFGVKPKRKASPAQLAALARGRAARAAKRGGSLMSDMLATPQAAMAREVYDRIPTQARELAMAKIPQELRFGMGMSGPMADLAKKAAKHVAKRAIQHAAPRLAAAAAHMAGAPEMAPHAAALASRAAQRATSGMGRGEGFSPLSTERRAAPSRQKEKRKATPAQLAALAGGRAALARKRGGALAPAGYSY
jgi:hypothetical protein